MYSGEFNSLFSEFKDFPVFIFSDNALFQPDFFLDGLRFYVRARCELSDNLRNRTCVCDSARRKFDIYGKHVTGIDSNKIKYIWSLDKGKIIEGQVTQVITVSTEGFVDTTTTATIEIKGLPTRCPNTASETSVMGCGEIYSILFDESELSST